MKVAHVNAGNEYGGGLVHIVSLLGELKTHEHEMDLIVLEEGPVAQTARDAGVNVIVLQQKNRYDLSVLYQLKQVIKNKQYTVLHTHGPRANAVLYLLRHFIQAKWVTTIHSNPLLDFKDDGLKGRLFETINKKAITKADGLIAVSNEIKETVWDLGAKSNHIEVVFNGINYHSVLPKKHSSQFTIVTIGRLHPIKGYDLLLHALSDCHFTNWHWIVCGEGPEGKKLRQLSEELGIDSKIDFVSWVDAKGIREHLSRANLFVHPSYSESFPLVLLEAAEQEVPILATNVGDVKHIVKESSMGWLIPPKDTVALKASLSEAYKDWQLNQLEEKGQALRDWTKQYTLAKQAENVLAFYKKIDS